MICISTWMSSMDGYGISGYLNVLYLIFRAISQHTMGPMGDQEGTHGTHLGKGSSRPASQRSNQGTFADDVPQKHMLMIDDA